MIAPQPFFEPRGTPISVYQRLQGLSELGHQVDLVTYPIGEDKDIQGVKIRRAPKVPFINKVRIGPSLAKLPLDFVVLVKVLSLLTTRRYDVIHSHEEAGFFSVPLSWLFRTPHIYDMHSSLPKQLANFNFGNIGPIVWLFETLENWVLKTCDVVLTIGTDLEEYVLEMNGSANHIRIENIAVHGDLKTDPARLDAMRQSLGITGKKAIVYTGTFERYQGFDILFESAREVVQSHPEAHYVMVGGKPHQVDQWKQETQKLGLEDHVTFTGLVSLEESVRYLQMADILVSPRTEGLSVPLKIYSYLHAARPIVATNIFAHTQILSDDTAALTDPTAASYAAGIQKVLDNPEWGAQIGKNAKACAENEYSKRAYLEKLGRAYQSVKQRKRISELISAEGVNANSTVAVHS